jgi:hypothetical protein
MEVTPRLTRHAVQRCAEMGISTKVAKAIVRRASVNRPSGHATIAVSDEEELADYAVIYYPLEIPLIISVVFRTTHDYVRAGITFDPIVPEEH